MSEAKTVLVTGANRGLGLEVCKQLGKRGWRVILTSRKEQEGKEATVLLKRAGISVEHRQLDVANPTSIAALVGELRKDSVLLDVLINNAGIAMQGFDANVAERTLAVNFFGAAAVTDALLPLVVDGGSIVMVSSGMGELSNLAPKIRARLLDSSLSRPALDELMRSFVRDVKDGRNEERGWPSSAYRVSKAGMNALVRILARELAGRKIRVNSVCPGWVRTDMGGKNAPRSLEEGAASIVWATTTESNGGFFRDGGPIP